MWLIHQNAILIKDNLLKRKWKSDPKCCFCPENESFNHLFFECSMAKFVWSLVALVVGADCRSPTFAQFWVWVQKYMANGTKFHMVGLSAICWALWRARNNICLRKKNCPISYWDHLYGFIVYSILGRTSRHRRHGGPGSGRRSPQRCGADVPPSEVPSEDTGMVLLHWRP